MNVFCVKVNDGEVQIDQQVFILLFENSYVTNQVKYKKSLADCKIKLKDLQELAKKIDTPYPLFFAPIDIVKNQILYKNKEISEKFPDKDEIMLNFRGQLVIEKIEPIIKDISRKQNFLRNRVLVSTLENEFVGALMSRYIKNQSNSEIALYIKNYFNFDLNSIRTSSVDKVLKYIIQKIEDKNIFISLSSHHYMPQNIDKNLLLSGFCVKDKKFPFIFINAKDGDDNPIIIENDGRKIFTLLSMLTAIGYNEFILNSKFGQSKKHKLKQIYAVVEEILIPESELQDKMLETFDDVKEYAKFFKVSPSMVVVRFWNLKKIDSDKYSFFMEQIKLFRSKKENTPSRSINTIDGYLKYNGARFSKEIVLSANRKQIQKYEIRTILFRKGKMDASLFNKFISRFS